MSLFALQTHIAATSASVKYDLLHVLPICVVNFVVAIFIVDGNIHAE